MDKEREIIFFVLGIAKETKGRYLARILRTQNGINTVTFDFPSRILTVNYCPYEIDPVAIKKLTYFSDCVFISDPEEIEHQSHLHKQHAFLDKSILGGQIVWVLLFVALIVLEVMGYPVNWIMYFLIFLLTIIIGGFYYYQKRIEKVQKNHTSVAPDIKR